MRRSRASRNALLLGGDVADHRTEPDRPQAFPSRSFRQIRQKRNVFGACRTASAASGDVTEPHGSGLGKTRYVVERTLAWFPNYRRLIVCYEKTGAHFQAFHVLAACVMC